MRRSLLLMASPHVAGAAALYLQGNAGATPSAVASEPPPPPPNVAPTADFTYSCTDLFGERYGELLTGSRQARSADGPSLESSNTPGPRRQRVAGAPS